MDAQRTAWGVTSDELARGTILQKSPNPHPGMNASDVVTVRLEDGRIVRGIFKAAVGEKTSRFSVGGMQKVFLFPAGTLYKREVAASALSDYLGFDLVPPTVERTVDGEVGSLQLFSENSWPPYMKGRAPPDLSRLDETLANRLAVFDYLVRNVDRDNRNWLVRDDGSHLRPVAIDNGQTFPMADPQMFHLPPDQGKTLNAAQYPSSSTQRLLARANPDVIAQILHDAGLSDAEVEQTLVRLRSMKRQSGML